MNTKRDIILLTNEKVSLIYNIEDAVATINKIINIVEGSTAFYNAHELVKRNHITKHKKKVSNALKSDHLKPFYFIINLN